MGSKKKKWYQTGEFEDGYQFGDIFRTIKNAIDKDEEKPKKSKNKTTKVSQNKKEAQTKKSNNANAFLPKVEKGKVSFDPAVQLYGFENETERQNYIKENPELYAAMGGVKYVPSGAPIKNTDSINKSGKAVENIIDRFNKTDVKELQNVFKTVGSGEW